MAAKIPNYDNECIGLDSTTDNTYDNPDFYMGLNSATMTNRETKNSTIQKLRTPIQQTIINESGSQSPDASQTCQKKVYSVLIVYGILLLISIALGTIALLNGAKAVSSGETHVGPTNPTKTPQASDCTELQQIGYTTSGLYDIYPSSTLIAPVKVWCDMVTEDGGWTVIQRREDGSVNFNSTFEQYRRGFGYVDGEFWIGNDNLHRITNQKSYKLRVEVDLWNGNQIVKQFDHFRIGDDVSKYQLNLQSGVSLDHYERTLRPLGMEDGRIPDRDITASSFWSEPYGANYGRLNYPATGSLHGAWIAKTSDANQWIQVAFASLHVIGGIITQGRNVDYNQWVTRYKVQHSDNGNSWTYVKNSSDQDAVFVGNSDRNTPVTNLFDAPVRAYFIRIQPTAWQQHISLRFEVLGFKGYTKWTSLNDQPFSTGDNGVGRNCAAVGGAWWYSDTPCVQTGLNGKYHKGAGLKKGITWEDTGITFQVKRTEMKIRPAE